MEDKFQQIRALLNRREVNETWEETIRARAALDALDARLTACEQERKELLAEVHEKNAILHERYHRLARAEEALRTCTTFSALARAYFDGKTDA